MRIAHIVPTEMLDQVLGKRDTYHLTLVSQVLKSQKYRQFYREKINQGDTVILDNDAYENGGSSTHLQDLKEAIELLWPSLVVLPDRINADSLTNQAMAIEAAEELKHYEIPFMAVPHAATLPGYFKCAEIMLNIPGVEALGIYKLFEKHLGKPRMYAIKQLSKYPVSLHLLGMTDDVRELANPFVTWRCAGLDTCRFVREALQGHRIRLDTPTRQYTGRGDNYFDQAALDMGKVSDFEKAENVVSTIHYWRRICYGS